MYLDTPPWKNTIGKLQKPWIITVINQKGKNEKKMQLKTGQTNMQLAQASVNSIHFSHGKARFIFSLLGKCHHKIYYQNLG